MTDLADPSYTDALELSVSKVADGRWHVTLRANEEWLTSTDRIYPVSIDPDFSWANGTTHFHGAQDCYIASLGQAGYNFCPVSYLTTGYYNRAYRSLLKFDIASAIPSDATVSAATFKAYAPPASPKAAANHSLHTVTSDWDSNVTWNNRKTGVAWTTAGGDYSTNSAYTSSATSVSTNPAWYTWTAPTATVQGWVNGTLPNYGFLLSTDNATGCCSYVFASTEASTSSQFPANSTQWPTLDVTWTEPTDTTNPNPPAHVAPSALASGAVTVSFEPGGDPEPTSGLAGTEVRRQVNDGSWTSWALVSGSSFSITGLSDGDRVALQFRTLDNAGNRSDTIDRGFEAAASNSGDAFDSGAIAFAKQEFGWSQSVAESWVDVQAKAIDLDPRLHHDSAASLEYVGLWFDTDNRRVKVSYLDLQGHSAIDPLVASAGLSSWVDYVSTNYSEYQLQTAETATENSLAADIDAGWVEVYYGLEGDGVRIHVAAGAPSATQTRVANAAATLSVPHSVINETEQQFTYTPQACSDDNALYSESDPPGQRADVLPRCDPPVRGGLAIDGVRGCTAGFMVRSNTDDKPYVLTAAHCFHDAEDGQAYMSVPWSAYAPVPHSSTALGPGHSVAPGSSCVPWVGCLHHHTDAGLISMTDSGVVSKGIEPWLYVTASTTGSTTEDTHFTLSDSSEAHAGQLLCMEGAKAGARCGRVLHKDWKSAGGDHIDLHVCGGLIGDSGGPVYARDSRHEGTGVGIIIEGNGDDGGCSRTIQDLENALDKLNVYLATGGTSGTQYVWDASICTPDASNNYCVIVG